MQTKQLPNYPGFYIRKTLGPFLFGVLFFAGAIICFVRGEATRHDAYLIAGGVCTVVFLGTLFFMMVRESRELLPAFKHCPDCGHNMPRLDEGSGSPIHYDCEHCQIRWETKLYVPDD